MPMRNILLFLSKSLFMRMFIVPASGHEISSAVLVLFLCIYSVFKDSIFHENRPGSKKELLILLAQIGDQKLQEVPCSAIRVRCQLKFLSRTITLSLLICIFKWSTVPGKGFKSSI